MQKPRFRTRVKLAPPLLAFNPERHGRLYGSVGIENPAKLDDPTEIIVATNDDILTDEYGISIPFLDEGWHLHDGSEWQRVMFAKVRDIHRARVEVARAPQMIRDQYDNLIRLVDHDNVDTLAETIRDTLKIAWKDVQDRLRAMGFGINRNCI